MLLALLTMWLLGGDADVRPIMTNEMAREVRDVVVDRERADEVLSSIRAFDTARSNYYDALEVAIEDLIDLNREHQATRTQYRALLDNADALRDVARAQFIASVFDVREKVSEEEWSALLQAVREE